MEISWIYPVQVANPSTILPFAQAAQRLGVARLWAGQSLLADTHQIFSYLAGAGVRMPFGSSVALLPLRHPIDAAVQARGIATMSGHPYVAGYGPGSREFQTGAMGAPFPRPVAATREFLQVARRLGQGGAEHDGQHHHCRYVLDPLDHPQVHWGAGVLRPGMAKGVAGAIDVAITWMTPPEYVRDHILPALAEGAALAGRPTPRVATVVHAVVDGAGRDMASIALNIAGAHLSSEHYTDMLRRSGVNARPENPETGAKSLVESGAFAHGTPQDIAAQLQRYRQCGVSEVIINPAGAVFSSGIGAAIREITRVTEAVHGQ